MWEMFEGAREFNQDISRWNVTSVIDFGFMFSNATMFNQDLSGWVREDVRISTRGVFQRFFSTLSYWFTQDVSGAVSFRYMFSNATEFDNDLSTWVSLLS